jgi:hypothetical protein
MKLDFSKDDNPFSRFIESGFYRYVDELPQEDDPKEPSLPEDFEWSLVLEEFWQACKAAWVAYQALTPHEKEQIKHPREDYPNHLQICHGKVWLRAVFGIDDADSRSEGTQMVVFIWPEAQVARKAWLFQKNGFLPG